MRFCNSGLKVSIERSDVAILSTDGERFEIKPVESEVARELIRLGATSPRALKRNILVPFCAATVKFLLGLKPVHLCTEEQDWFDLGRALEEIAGFASIYEAIRSVKNGICDQMYSTISDQNCFLLHKKFVEHDCKSHSAKTLEYIKYNLVRMVVLDSSVDVQFFRLSAEDVEQLLDSDDLNLDKEIHVAEVVNKWVIADRLRREKFRPMLLSTVRISALDNQTVGMFADYNLSMKLPRKTRDILIVVGGWLHQKACDRIEWFDPEFNAWFVSQQKLPMALAYHGAVFLDGHLYLFGGSNGSKTRCETWKLSPRDWNWERCDNMMEPRNYISNSSVVYDGKIYVFGGQNWREITRNLQRSRTGEMYDPKTNRWTSTASLHDMRSDCAACVFNDHIYVCGGFNGDVILASVEVYNPLGDFFARLVNLPYPLSGHCLVVHLNRMFLIGGFDGQTRQQKILVYQGTGEWAEHEEQLIQGRSTSSMCIYKGSVVAVGGFTSKVERTCEIMLKEPGVPLQSVSSIIRGKSALRAMVAPNWRDYLENRGTMRQCDLEPEEEEMGDDYGQMSSASSELDNMTS